MAWEPLPADLQSRAVAQWGREGLVEIVVLSGFYQMFAAFNQGFNIKTQDVTQLTVCQMRIVRRSQRFRPPSGRQM
jgi:hypothetical protein